MGLQTEECRGQMWGVRGFLGLQKGGAKGAGQTGDSKVTGANSIQGDETGPADMEAAVRDTECLFSEVCELSEVLALGRYQPTGPEIVMSPESQ